MSTDDSEYRRRLPDRCCDARSPNAVGALDNHQIINARAAQRNGGGDAAKTGPDDDDPWWAPTPGRRPEPAREVP